MTTKTNPMEFNLLGKDYLTAKEAAFYAGVSASHFQARREQYGVMPLRFMGKVLYRKADIKNAIERGMDDLVLPM